MEDPGLGLLLKNGQRSQWEGEETMAVGGTVGKCLWVLLSKARQRVRRTESTPHAPRLSSRLYPSYYTLPSSLSLPQLCWKLPGHV